MITIFENLVGIIILSTYVFLAYLFIEAVLVCIKDKNPQKNITFPQKSNISFEVSNKDVPAILKLKKDNPVTLTFDKESLCIVKIKYKNTSWIPRQNKTDGIQWIYLFGLNEDNCIGFKNDLWSSQT
jgi:hypothetical protein